MPDKCDHYWCYVHGVYGGETDDGGKEDDETLVRRWCSRCGTEQVGEVTKWREPKPDEFDKSAEQASKEFDHEET